MDRDEIRRRFRWVTIGYCILALGAAGGVYFNERQTDRLDRHTEALAVQQQQIKRNQQAISANLDRIVRLTRNTAAALCLIAEAPTQKAQNDIIHTFVVTGKIDISHNAECRQAANKAAELILVEH